MFQRLLVSSNKKIRKVYHFFSKRSLHITGAVGAFSILLGLGKIISGIFSLSIFVCMSGCYTLGMAVARYCAIVGKVRSEERKNQYFYYRLAGMIMIIASLLYVAYSIWTIYNPKEVNYGEIAAITIATITFTEIGVNLYGVMKYRKGHSPFLHALKTISLGTSLISLVLTQAAILAFAADIQKPSVNGLLGAIMGTCAALLGFYMIGHINRIHKNDTYETGSFE
ncbi:hypothetical protein [Anaerosporobacter sp.]